jgi:hypothetical protein
MPRGRPAVGVGLLSTSPNTQERHRPVGDGRSAADAVRTAIAAFGRNPLVQSTRSAENPPIM